MSVHQLIELYRRGLRAWQAAARASGPAPAYVPVRIAPPRRIDRR